MKPALGGPDAEDDAPGVDWIGTDAGGTGAA